jgi:uncharacterized membrane protein YbhN (UPF0104 family)
MSDAPADSEPAPGRLVQRTLLLAGLALLALAAVLWLPALEPVRDRFADTDGDWVGVACALQLASALSFVAAFRGAFERRIGWRASFDLAAVEQGANVLLPSGGSGGLAIGALLLVRAGVPMQFAASRTAVLFLVTSAVSLASLVLVGTAGAIGLLPGEASLAALLAPAAGGALVMIAAVALPLWIPPIRAQDGQRLRSILHRVQVFLNDAVAMSVTMIRRGDTLLIAGSVGYFVFDAASLAAAFRALGESPIGLSTFTLAYVLGHAGALLPVPGSAEGGLVGTFVAYGSPVSLAIGAVLVYRTFHAGVPILLGLFGYADIRRLRRHSPPPEVVARRFR